MANKTKKKAIESNVEDNNEVDILDFYSVLKRLERKMLLNAEPIMNKIIEQALSGDRFSQKLYVDKFVPNRDVRLLKVPVDSLRSLEDIRKAEELIIRGVYTAEYSYEEGRGLMSLLNNYKETVFTLKYANKSDIIEQEKEKNSTANLYRWGKHEDINS